jgi:hypothetical protein
MEIKDRNLLRTIHAARAEFEIAEQEYRNEQKIRGRRFFLDALDYNSFLRGFVAGLRRAERGAWLEDESKQPGAKK